jgi:hypothetical protein
MTTDHVDVENRESRARYGRTYRAVLFLDVPLKRARRVRGVSIAPGDRNQSRPSPFTDPSLPLLVMVDPGLDRADPSARMALELCRKAKAAEILRASFDPHPAGDGEKTVEFEDLGPQDHGVHGWAASLDGSTTWVPMSGDYLDVAHHAYGVSDPVAAHSVVLAGRAGVQLGCDVFLTTNGHLLDYRSSLSGSARKLAPVAPTELVRMLGVLLRPQNTLPTCTGTWIRGGVYEATVHDWVPAYLSLYRHLCTRFDSDRSLDYLEGLLGNCALSVMALDRLALLHFVEDTVPANNSSSARQQYESAALVTAVTAALESLAWVLVTLSGVQVKPRDVTFRRIVETSPRGHAPWLKGVSAYCPEAVAAFKAGFAPSLQLLLHFRDRLQHHVPIPAAVGNFGRIVRVNGEEQFIDDQRMGVLHTEGHLEAAKHWLDVDEASGVLPEAIVPYPYMRTALHDMFSTVQSVLREAASKLGASGEDPGNPYCGRAGDSVSAQLPRFMALSL